MRKSVIQRTLGRFDNVAGRVEVRLADLQVNDVAALCFELPGAGKHGKRRLGAQSPHGGRQAGMGQQRHTCLLHR